MGLMAQETGSGQGVACPIMVFGVNVLVFKFNAILFKLLSSVLLALLAPLC